MSGAVANPLLCDQGLIDYAAVQPEHIVPAIQARLADAQSRLSALESAPPAQAPALLRAIESLGDGLGRAWGAVSHLMSVANSPALREAHQTVQPAVVAFWSSVSQSQGLHAALVSARQALGNDGDPVLTRILDTEIKDFVHGGVGLPPEARARFSAIRQELAQASTSFANHHLDSTKAWCEMVSDPAQMAGVPARVRAMCAAAARERGEEQANAENGPWALTLDAPVLQPLLQHAQQRDLRQRLHQAFSTRASEGEHDNRPLIRKILNLRQELAGLLGFDSYAELSLDSKMAPSVAAVDELLDALVSAATPHAKADLNAMAELAAADGISGPLRAWDIPFYAERLRERRLDLNEEALRAYFPLDRVLSGLFAMLEGYFDIQVKAADGEAPVWHPDVRFFRIFDGNGKNIAAFYLDAYARPGAKRSGAWMNGITSRSSHLPGGMVVDGVRIPVAVLVTNAPQPSADTPSLLGWREVETLFHECGHGLQHMLTTVDTSLAAGIHKVEWDAVELPSQFLENWCYHPPTLERISAHYQSGEPLPAAEAKRLIAARHFNQGWMTLRQCTFARMDLRLHHGFQPGGNDDAIALQAQVTAQTMPIPAEDYDHFLCSFAHLFAGGYGAGYYSYKWAEVLAADAWGAFEDVGLDNDVALRATAQRFRDTVLALGGSVHPMQVFIAFRGREPQPDALIRLCGLDRPAA